jgi:hypothetical protein
MLNSLIGQLVEELREKSPIFEFYCLQGCALEEASKSIDVVLSMVDEMFQSLPTDAAVFILIDSVSQIDMLNKSGSEKVLRRFLVTSRNYTSTVKIALADMLQFKIPAGYKGQHEDLFLPDKVDDGNNGTNQEQALEGIQDALDGPFTDAGEGLGCD